MNRSRFNVKTSTLERSPRRAFLRCSRCKVRWVSPTMTRVEVGEIVYAWLSSDGTGWKNEVQPSTRRRLGSVDFPNCPQCGRQGDCKLIDAIRNEDKKCDDRCTTAKGHKCECSCGGENHGAAVALSLGAAA